MSQTANPQHQILAGLFEAILEDNFIEENRLNLCDYLRISKTSKVKKIKTLIENYLIRRAGADLQNNIPLLDPLSYVEELTGKEDGRHAHLLRTIEDGEDYNDVYK